MFPFPKITVCWSPCLIEAILGTPVECTLIEAVGYLSAPLIPPRSHGVSVLSRALQSTAEPIHIGLILQTRKPNPERVNQIRS